MLLKTRKYFLTPRKLFSCFKNNFCVKYILNLKEIFMRQFLNLGSSRYRYCYVLQSNVLQDMIKTPRYFLSLSCLTNESSKGLNK